MGPGLSNSLSPGKVYTRKVSLFALFPRMESRGLVIFSEGIGGEANMMLFIFTQIQETLS